MRTRTARKVRRWTANLLFLAGLIALSLWAWANIRGAAYQSWGSWAFERKAHGQTATLSQYLRDESNQVWGDIRALLGLRPVPSSPLPSPPAARQLHGPPPVIADGDLIGRLSIPRLHIGAMVREGAGANTLEVALGHIPGTAMPGQDGNVGIAGHRDTLFRGLGEIRKHDIIRFQTMAGDYVYEVERTEIVTPRSVDALQPGQYPEMTLVTCYPFRYIGPAPDRFIVQARLVNEGPAGPDTAQAPARPLANPHNLARPLRRAHAN